MGRGDSESAHNRHAQASRADVTHIRPADHPPTDILTFSPSDIQDIHYPHDNPLVVILTIANYVVKRMLINTGISSDILFSLAFYQL